jgi:hypothetical protein
MAAKKQSKSKKKERRRLKLQEQAERTRFLEKVKRHEMAEGREILVDPPDQVKISKVVLDFAAPLLERFEQELPVKNLIAIAIFGWNLSLLPDEKHSEFLDKMAGTLSLDEEGVKEMEDIMKWLVDRRRKHFSEHRRRVLDYRLSDLGDRRNLQVVSVSVPTDRQSDPD